MQNPKWVYPVHLDPFFHGAIVNCRIVEKFLEASEEEKRRMQIMYGVKVLNKLVAAWQAEAANRGYLKENTVRASSLVVIVSVIIFFQISFSHYISSSWISLA